MPPALAGRGPVLEEAGLGITRVAAGLHVKNMLLVGLRGVGKTVLLNSVQADVDRRGFYAADCEWVETNTSPRAAISSSVGHRTMSR
jgi:hypothetical protein